MLLGPDVIDLEPQFGKALREMAVLAAKGGALAHLCFEPRLPERNFYSLAPAWRRESRALDFRNSSTLPIVR